MTGLDFWTDQTPEQAAATIFAATSDNDWDTLILGGAVWPGIAVVGGDGVSRKLDVKKGKGADQATIKDEGYRNAKLSVTLTMWTPAQWIVFQALLPTIHPRAKGGKRDPLGIIHPAANLLGIDNVYVQKIGLPDVDSSTGIMTITIDLLEWVNVPKPVKKGSGTGGPATLEDGLNEAIAEVLAGIGDTVNETTDAVTDALGGWLEDTFLGGEPLP